MPSGQFSGHRWHNLLRAQSLFGYESVAGLASHSIGSFFDITSGGCPN